MGSDVNRANLNGKLGFYTAAEIARIAPAQPDWIAKPWADTGTIIEIDGKPQFAGKTTFLLWLARGGGVYTQYNYRAGARPPRGCHRGHSGCEPR